jgi:predicted protein tyrosine phosphatase
MVFARKPFNDKRRMTKPNILFVCTVNRMRSATAEKIYADDERFCADSVGTDRTATVRIEDWHLEWADYIVVMERAHRGKIQRLFPQKWHTKPIHCLHIPDVFDFMQPELVELLRQKFERLYEAEIAEKKV